MKKTHKLTYDQAQEIRARATGKHGEQSALAREFGVTQTAIWAILNNKVYTAPPPTKEEQAIYHKDLTRRKRQSHLKHRFGMTSDEYDKMFEEQKGLCAICGKEPSGQTNSGSPHRRLCVDHDHRTGKVRALLCNPCNKGIGHLKDDVETVLKAYEYLRRFDEDRGH